MVALQRAPALAFIEIAVRGDSGEVQTCAFDAGRPVTIGRDSTCELVLPHQEVSRRHATIERVGDDLRIADSSANGSIVSGAPLRGTLRTLAPGDVVRIGAFSLQARLVPDASVAFAPNAPAEHPVELPRAASHQGEPAWADRPPLHISVAVRRRIHRMLLEHLDLARLDRNELDGDRLRPQVVEALHRILAELDRELPLGLDRERLIAEMTDEALGLGPLEALLADQSVSEIMVVDPATIFCERNGVIEHTPLRFTDDESARAVIERIITPLGRRIDESNPYVDARLPDGSRVNAIIRPLALRGACITIRKFGTESLTLDELIRFGSLTEQMARFLTRAVRIRKNIVISGGTGSGKTTLLNILSGAVSDAERIVTIEDAAELRMRQIHVVSLEARPPNMEGRGAITIRDLVRNALRMRPDRIIVGECRGGEALDMLQAMNTGHDGSMTTLHANSPHEALSRLETLSLMAGLDLPSRAIREQVASSVDLVVQQTRLSDGTRRVMSIAEVVGLDHDGSLEVCEIFQFARTGSGPGGAVVGEFRATGYLPSFLDDFVRHGLVGKGEYL
jgi:pilus assembly protein CpaF